MISKEIREKFLEFFKQKDHKVIPSASLVPENDSTVLFTTAGMHPLVPFLLGELHPQGSRLVSVQKCLRTDDIDEVGDDTHNTFFEMLGNWSLGDPARHASQGDAGGYWKEDSIKWSYEFLTDKKWLGLDPKFLAITVFAGDEDAPRDEESAEIWQRIGIPKERIAYLPKEDNWWGPPGETGPCGPNTEMFFWTGSEKVPEKFNPEDKLWVEVWNDVFMDRNKTIDGKFEFLKQKNVDTGMGMERIAAVMQKKNNIYDTDLFSPLLEKIRSMSKNPDLKAERIISDHLRAATFLIADGVVPSNKDRGYILRRLIRRAVTYGKKLGIENEFSTEIAAVVIKHYQEFYLELSHHNKILEELDKEETKFRETLTRGLKLIEGKKEISGKEAFDLFQTYGFPYELTKELVKVTDGSFHEELKKHQELSRTASSGQFKGGLASHSDKIVRLHTATHLMNAALRKVLGNTVLQKGSNITEERTRFDFTHALKLTDEEKQKVEDLVNDWITRDLSVKKETMMEKEARDLGAIGVFGEKYPETVSVYTVFDPKAEEVISREFCGGPHVEKTGIIGQFKIQKEEAVSAGVRRIKAVVE